MSIGGPGGIGGPNGPKGPASIDAPDGADAADNIEGPDRLDGAGSADAADATSAASSTSDIDALAAEVAAGRLTPREAIDRLVEATATPGLDAAERAELREMITDLVANDPYLSGLADRVG